MSLESFMFKRITTLKIMLKRFNDMKYSKKQISYYAKWETKRAHKIKYVLKEGLLFWALPFTVFMMMFKLIDNQFIVSLSIVKDGLLIYGMSSVLGIFWALYTFKKHDDLYLKLKRKHIL